MATLIDIPPELIDAIVEHIPDVASLKSCSLVSPIFRFPGQKRLHHTLQLEFAGPDSQRHPRRTLGAVSRRLQESPHLASFITHLTLEIITPWNGPDDQSAFARRVFGSLGHVKKTSISGGRLGGAIWSSLPPDMESAVLEWLAHRGSTEPLQELVLANIRLPEAVLPVVCSAAASLALSACKLERMPASQQQATVQSAPRPQIEAHSSWKLAESPCNTRRLTLTGTVENDPTSLGMFAKLCALSAETLKSLQFADVTEVDSEHKTFLLQEFTTTLPCLCEVRVMLQRYGLGLNSALDNSLWVLQSALRPALLPRLTHITYVVPVAYSPDGAGLPAPFESDWSTPYDEFVVDRDHPTLSSFIWEPKFFRWANSPSRLLEDHKQQQFERFRAEMQRIMPRAHAKGLLVFRRGN